MILEICVDNLESVAVCAAAGVERIELCACLADGGLTPSAGFLQAARNVYGGKIMAMLRPRGGDFCYSAQEVDLMLAEVDFLRAGGADGIVFGMLRPDGTVDEDACRKIITRAEGMEIVFHRAIDVSRDLHESLETLIALGVTRVLTSGGQPDVARGAETLAMLVEQAAGRIAILAGGGLKVEGIANLVRSTGLSEVHFSARRAVDGPMVFRHPELDFSPPGSSDHKRMVTCAATVERALAALEEVCG